MKENPCGDCLLYLPPAENAAARIMTAVNALTPAGKTPLTAAVGQAAEVLHFRVKPGLIVVLTDGEETCSGPRSSLRVESLITIHHRLRSGRLHEKHEQRAQSVQHEVQRGGN